MTCEICNGTGWEIREDGARRCKCRKKAREVRQEIPSEALASAVEAIGALAFYPRDPKARTMIGDALAGMCGSVEALRYVARRAVGLYKTWDECGIPGLRQILCSRYRPADGIEAGPTAMFPEGLKAELQLASPEVKLLPGGAVSVDSELQQAVTEAANAIRARTRRVYRPLSKQEIAAAPDWIKRLEGRDA